MNDLVDFRIAKKFRQGVDRARKKAGRKIGKSFVAHRRHRLGAAQPRRKKAVISRVARDGTLIVYDMAPMARASEFGATIRPRAAAQLYIEVSKLAAGELPVRRGDYLLAVGKNKQTRLLGVYRDEVVIPQAQKTRRFFDQIEDLAPDYEAALLTHFDEENILL